MTAPESEPGLIDLVIEAEEWDEALPDLAAVAEAVARAGLAATGLDPAGYEICLLACDDARIQALNARHRDQDKPTNVLSWPGFSLAPATPGAAPPAPPPGAPNRPVALGDVAIALQTVQREAQDAAIPLKSHAAHLILHGVLHLLGYDHLTEADAELMEGIESRVLPSLGYSDPYSRDVASPHRHEAK